MFVCVCALEFFESLIFRVTKSRKSVFREFQKARTTHKQTSSRINHHTFISGQKLRSFGDALQPAIYHIVAALKSWKAPASFDPPEKGAADGGNESLENVRPTLVEITQ